MKDKHIKGKKVLITGITGFIGQHLSRRLTKLGAMVYGISQSKNGKNITQGNILYFDFVNDLIKKRKIQQCYHLAGESLVEGGQSAPFQTFKVNIQGTLNILESARVNRLEKIVIASTSHVYGKNKLPYYEGYTPKPTRPYETSKACTDLLAQSYADTLGLPVIIPRFVNIYGPGDLNFNRIIPKIIKSLYSDGVLKMWGGEARRDYLFIDDAINAYINMANADITDITKNRVFNFGSGNIISVNELLRRILKLSKMDLRIERVLDERPDEIREQYVSFKKAKKILNWEPKTGIDEGLLKTLTWYRKYFKA